MRRFTLLAVASTVLLLLAAVATRATATTSANAIRSEDHDQMDASRLGPMPRASAFYRVLDTAVGELRTPDGQQTLGVVASWSSILGLAPDGSRLWGFALGEPAPPSGPKSEERTEAYKDWLKAQRLELFVGDGPKDRTGDPLVIHWRGRDLPAEVFDVDPTNGLAYYVVQLDDGATEDDESSERAPKIPAGKLELAPEIDSPVVVRGPPSEQPDTRGFVASRASRSIAGDRDVVRGLSGALPVGAPVAYLLADGSGPAIIGMISSAAPEQGLAGMASAEAINAFGRTVAEAVADRPRPNAVLGVATHTEIDAGGRVIVDQVEPATPAATNGLMAGDVIERVDEMPTPSRSALIASLAQRRPGERVEITLRRGEERRTVQIELGARG